MASAQHQLKKNPVDEQVEYICEQGCRTVRKTIDHFDHGELTADLQHLSDEERHHVIRELKDIMSVYEANGTRKCGS